MRLNLILASLAVASLTATSAMAEDGQYSAALSRILAEAAQGNCPADVMGEGLLAACQQQITAMSAGLKTLGAVSRLTLKTSETTSLGVVETYEVAFEGGHTMSWSIGGLKDGRFEAVYSPG